MALFHQRTRSRAVDDRVHGLLCEHDAVDPALGHRDAVGGLALVGIALGRRDEPQSTRQDRLRLMAMEPRRLEVAVLAVVQHGDRAQVWPRYALIGAGAEPAPEP